MAENTFDIIVRTHFEDGGAAGAGSTSGPGGPSSSSAADAANAAADNANAAAANANQSNALTADVLAAMEAAIKQNKEELAADVKTAQENMSTYYGVVGAIQEVGRTFADVTQTAKSLQQVQQDLKGFDWQKTVQDGAQGIQSAARVANDITGVIGNDTVLQAISKISDNGALLADSLKKLSESDFMKGVSSLTRGVEGIASLAMVGNSLAAIGRDFGPVFSYGSDLRYLNWQDIGGNLGNIVMQGVRVAADLEDLLKLIGVKDIFGVQAANARASVFGSNTTNVNNNVTDVTNITNINNTNVSQTTLSPQLVSQIEQTATPQVVQNATPQVVQNATQTVTQNVSQAATQDATQAVVQQASPQVVQDATQTVVQDATTQVTQDATQQVVQDATEMAEQTVVQDATQTVVQNATQEVVQDATQITTQTVVQNATQVVVQEATGPVVQAATGPVSQAAATAVEQAATPAIEQAAIPVVVQEAVQSAVPTVIQESITPVVVASTVIATPIVAATATPAVIAAATPAVIAASFPVVVSEASAVVISEAAAEVGAEEAAATIVEGTLSVLPEVAAGAALLLARGTDFAEGGTYVVGEEGPELVKLPRGSQVIPNTQYTNMQQSTLSDFDQVNAIGAMMQRQIRASLGIRGY